MTDHGHTCDNRDNDTGFDTLTPGQRELGEAINRTARRTGADRHDLLFAVDASDTDKAALAELWGGPDAGQEFQR